MSQKHQTKTGAAGRRWGVGRSLSPLLFLALFAWGSAVAAAQPSMSTILTNGPVSNRLNVVVLSEGYTNSQLAQFLVDATNAVNAMLNHQPYAEYRSYFNVFAIKVASNQSGSDHPNSSVFHDTYFNSSYDPISDLILTIPPNDQDTNYSHGQGKVDALLQTFMPNAQLPVLLVNDVVPGGSDGFDKTAISSIAASSSEFLAHETGHVLANLGDEYIYAYPGFPDTEEPNTTRETNRNSIKWKAWISTNTPVPTPTNSQTSTNVGLFEGAHYHSTNWFRPQLNCAMGNFSSPFCEVCSEALILAIYQRVRPVDAFAPAGTNLSVSTTQALSFNVSLLQPATRNLSIQWHTNGVMLAGATNGALSLLPQTLPNGTNLVAAVVRDTTPWVRNDPTNLLTQTVTWKVNVNLPQLNLDSPVWLAAGKLVFRVTGYAPQGFAIHATTNLSNWTSLSTNALVGGQFWYTNNAASSFPKRFFRAVTPP